MRYSTSLLEKGFVLKLKAAYSEMLRRSSDWFPLDNSGNPAASAVVSHYLAFSEQKKNGIFPSQAPAMLRPALRFLLVSMRNRLTCESQAVYRTALVRDIAVFTIIAFQMGRRDDDQHKTFGEEVMKLSQGEGFIPSFPFGKTLRVGGAQAVPVRSDRSPAICPVAALTTYLEVARSWHIGTWARPIYFHTLTRWYLSNRLNLM